MNREILFRGFHEDPKGKETIIIDGKAIKGTWIYGAFCGRTCESPFGKMQDSANIIKYGDPYDGFWFDVIPSTVGQFTGLKDKYGKRIFEGDIVRHGNRNYAIKYLPEYTRFAGTRPKIVCAVFNFKACEVIGNIFENPELLEGKL